MITTFLSVWSGLQNTIGPYVAFYRYSNIPDKLGMNTRGLLYFYGILTIAIAIHPDIANSLAVREWESWAGGFPGARVVVLLRQE